MSGEQYESKLVERIQGSTVGELTTLLAFFDCVQLRRRHADLVQALKAELERRGVRAP